MSIIFYRFWLVQNKTKPKFGGDYFIIFCTFLVIAMDFVRKFIVIHAYICHCLQRFSIRRRTGGSIRRIGDQFVFKCLYSLTRKSCFTHRGATINPGWEPRLCADTSQQVRSVRNPSAAICEFTIRFSPLIGLRHTAAHTSIWKV